MKLSVVFVIVAFATIVYAAPQSGYSTKFDSIDLEAIIANDRLVDSYVACLLERGKCTAEGEELKKNMKDAVETCCSKCSDKQKKGTRIAFSHLEKNKPEKLSELRAKFDPTGEYEKECRKKLTA
ncbi:ejaculatory bulb-specific protein 3-like [Chrysoperla carnea]|uniref:ejaculatory bulb-specific protein 3-like n=1 Tax=Chrysoperla carnea TaxID=189513 RepID=UPI001D09387B|nr:ejaculatory bulb-specific protein 3-like [Chrysoperla carnea]